ncbi:MAG: hypothetical protein AAF074_04275 [Pseudomonadota bacterium]
MISRRTALFGAGGAGLLALGGGVGFWLLPPTRFIEAVVRDHFRGGEADNADLRRFAEDFLARHPQWTGLRHRLFGKVGSVALVEVMPNRKYIDEMREEILAAFILGSTAMRRADESEPVEYLGFPDPYEMGCIPAFA